jgi:hypothetical protein
MTRRVGAAARILSFLQVVACPNEKTGGGTREEFICEAQFLTSEFSQMLFNI